MNRLLAIGFESAGHWLLENGALELSIARHSAQRNVLYAFVCDGQVRYIGKTTRALATRMANYRKPGAGQSTNINNNRRIQDLLKEGGAVEILVLPDNGLMHYGQFHLNLAAGLEDSLIRIMKPDWNGGMKEVVAASVQGGLEAAGDERIADAEASAVNDEADAAAPVPTHLFEFTLQPTYYAKGFFNVSVKSQQHFGADGERVEVFLGGERQPVLGLINRSANMNNTPRIMVGIQLRDWFHRNASVMAAIACEVMSPTSIRLEVAAR